jgi:hypothetical protein
MDDDGIVAYYKSIADLAPDAKVVVSESRGNAAPSEAGNPFATKLGAKAK